LRGERQSLWLIKEGAFHALHIRPELTKPLSQFESRGHHAVEMIPAMRDTPDGECSCRDNESIGAHGPKKSQPKLVGRSAVVRVEQNDFRNRVVQINRFEAATQPDCMSRMQWTADPSTSLGDGNGHESGLA